MIPENTAASLTDEEIIDLHNRVSRLQNALETLFGILWDNTDLSPELRLEIRDAYKTTM